LMPRSKRISLSSGTNLGHKNHFRDSMLSYGENPESVSPRLGSVRYRNVAPCKTDGETDRQNYDS